MSEAQIIKTEDFTVASSVWIIKRHATGEVVWQKKGGAIGLMVDNDSYISAFEGMFPNLVIRWGAGIYRLEAILEGSAVGRIANIAAYWEAPDYDTAQAARKEIAGGLLEPSFVTRTTHRDTTKLQIRTHNGNLQGDAQEQRVVVGSAGAPQQKPGLPYGVLGAGNTVGNVGTPVEPPQSVHPKAALARALGVSAPSLERTMPSQERVTFENGMRVIAGALRGTLIKRQLTWADRLRGLGDYWDERIRSPKQVPDPIAPEPLKGRFHTGQSVTVEEVDHKLLFHLAGDSTGQRAFLRWMQAFQQAENQLLSTVERLGHEGDGPDLTSRDTVTGLIHAMVDEAATLYLVESATFPDVTNKVPVEEKIDVIKSCCAFIADKDADYGQAIRRFGTKGILVRLFDKYSRYATLASRDDRAAKFESIEDTAKDMLCYSLILQAFWQEVTEDAKPELGA